VTSVAASRSVERADSDRRLDDRTESAERRRGTSEAHRSEGSTRHDGEAAETLSLSMAFRRVVAGAGARRPPGGQPAARWRSPYGALLTSIFGSALLIRVPVVILTGCFLYAYGPQFGQAIPGDSED